MQSNRGISNGPLFRPSCVGRSEQQPEPQAKPAQKEATGYNPKPPEGVPSERHATHVASRSQGMKVRWQPGTCMEETGASPDPPCRKRPPILRPHIARQQLLIAAGHVGSRFGSHKKYPKEIKHAKRYSGYDGPNKQPLSLLCIIHSLLVVPLFIRWAHLG